ncbi:MAG: alpha/beta fold hydrolase [Dermatophilaceae bacterium]
MTDPRARVVLVHGTRVSGIQWAAHRSWLEPEFEVITPDLPRHGSRAEVPFTMASAVEVVADTVASTPDGIPVVLAGHSLGGYVSMTYASQHSDRLAGLVLIGSTAVPSGPGAAIYRALGWATDTAGPARMARFNDRILTRIAPPEVADPDPRGGVLLHRHPHDVVRSHVRGTTRTPRHRHMPSPHPPRQPRPGGDQHSAIRRPRPRLPRPHDPGRQPPPAAHAALAHERDHRRFRSRGDRGSGQRLPLTRVKRRLASEAPGRARSHL